MEIAALGLRVDGVRDIDQASASLDRFTKSGSEAEKSVGGVGKTSRESSRSVSDLGKTSDNTRTNFTALARSAAGVAASLGLIVSVSSVFRSMVDTTSSFENSMAKVRAITRATDADMVRLSKTARELGASTVFSAAEAADGLQFLGMAGFNTQQAISAIPGVLDLAASSAMGLAQTADIATNVMSGFSLAAAESGRVADILAAASSRANTDVAQLGDAMSTVAPIAAAMNISIEDTAAAIGVLSDAGIQGSRAGTSLRGVFAALAGPTTQAQKILARVGLTVQDINPEFSDLETVLGRLSTAGLSTADMMQIFGREAASGAIVLAEAAGRVGELGDELRGAEGEARRMAETMQDTLTGDTKELSSAIEELLLNLNDKTGLQAMLRGSTQRSTELVSGFNTLLNESELLNETLRLISSTAGALIDAVKLMVGGIVDAVRGFGDMIGAVKLAEASLPGLTRAVRFFADGIQDASIWLQFFGNVVKGAFSGDVRTIQNSWAQLQEAFKERVAERETRRLNDAVEDLLENTDLFGTFEGAVTDAVGQLAEDAIDAAGGVEDLDDELQKLIKSLQSVVDKYDLSGARARQLKKDHAGLQQAMAMGLPGAKEAMDAYNESIKAVEQSTETLAVTTEESADWMATAFERGVERMRDGIGDFFERMIVDGKASFSDLTDLFKKMIAEMIATAAANRIMIGLGFAGGSAAAAAGGLGSGSGAGGLSNLFSVAQMANTAKTIWSGVQGIAAGEGLSGFSGLGGQLTSGITLWADKVGMNLNQGLSSLGQGMGQLAWGLESTGYTIAEAVGIQGISAGNATLIGSAATAGAGWAGGYAGAGLGRDLFGKEGSGWGATGGAMLGAYVGSIIPGLGTVLGSALGGLVGGVVDSIFGSSAWNTTRGGLQLGFDESGEFAPMQWTRQTKKGGLFSSTRRRYRFHELDEELDAALNETYSAALDGVREMYGVLGVAVEDGLLESVQIDTLKIGTSGKSKQTQEQIDAQITQWFADLQESAVQAIDSSLTSETLTLYASSLASVNEIFDAIGLSAYEVSIQGGKTSAQLLALAGGIENLLNATDYYYQNFYSEQERLANLTEQTTAAFESLGYALPDSAVGFRNLVESIDRTTEAGQAMFLQLLNLAPAMHTIASAAEAAARAVVDTAFGAVQRSVAAQQKRIQDAHAAHMRSLNDMASTASANINEMVRVSNALDTAMRRLRGTSDDATRSLRAQALMTLNSALETARSGQPLAGFEGLQDALNVASQMDAALYQSMADFEREQGRTANLLAELEKINGKQLSAEERLLNAVQAQIRAAEQQHERQMSALSMQLSYAQSQLDALNGLDSTIMSVTQAVNAMNAAMIGALKSMPSGSAKANTPANNKTIVDTLYETILGREADSGGRVYWQYQLQSGALDYSNISETLARAAIENPDETAASKQAAREFLRNQGIPGFASGGYHTGGLRIVGERGPELEATGPARIFNARQTAAMLNGGGNAETVAELRQLRNEIHNDLRQIAKYTQQTARRVEYLERWDYDGIPAERVIV